MVVFAVLLSMHRGNKDKDRVSKGCDRARVRVGVRVMVGVSVRVRVGVKVRV